MEKHIPVINVGVGNINSVYNAIKKLYDSKFII